MNAPVPQVKDTKSSITLDKIDKAIMVSKRAWYKEAAGFLAIMTWAAIVLINTWAILADSPIPQPLYLAVLYCIALAASAIRNNTAKVDLQKTEL